MTSTRVLIVALVSAAFVSGCGDHGSRSGFDGVSAAQLAGTYDVTTADVPSLAAIGDELLGSVTAGEDGALEIDILRGTLATTALRGHLADDGGVTLTGTDEVAGATSDVSGTALAHVTGETYRIDATLEGAIFGGTHVMLTMQRPVDASLAGTSGRYRFDFPLSPSGCVCPSSATIDLTFDASGSGASATATDVAASGETVGTIEAAQVFLAPSGDVVLHGQYSSVAIVQNVAPFTGTIGFVGVLQSSGTEIAGYGTFEHANRFVPPFLPRGEWSARRVSP